MSDKKRSTVGLSTFIAKLDASITEAEAAEAQHKQPASATADAREQVEALKKFDRGEMSYADMRSRCG